MSETKKEEKVDPVQKFYALEDDLARAAGHKQLRDDFLKESGHLRSILEAIVAGESTEPISPSVLLHVANMRRLSRLAQYLTAQKKQETTKYLEQVEAKFLELQNSTSEIQHLQKQVKRCLEFSAGDEDLNMIPEEEFYEKAPETISLPEKTKEDEHARYLARLNWELEQRKELAGNLNDHETRRSVLLSDIEAKEQRLRNLQPAIASLIKAAKPVQELLGLQQQQQYEPAASITPEPAAPATPDEPMEQ